MLGLYALLLGEAGLRAYSEALHLQWEDVDLEEGFLHVRSGRDDIGRSDMLYSGFDLHKRTVVISTVDDKGSVVAGASLPTF